MYTPNTSRVTPTMRSISGSTHSGRIVPSQIASRPKRLFEKGWRSDQSIGYTWGMNPQTYPPDLTDRQWDCIIDLIPTAKPGGRPRSLDMRQVINAILYIVVS